MYLSILEMMVAVLKARFRAEQVHATVAGDRGSELGDFDADDYTCIDCTDTLDDENDLSM